jgi:hypothetical protein
MGKWKIIDISQLPFLGAWLQWANYDASGTYTTSESLVIDGNSNVEVYMTIARTSGVYYYGTQNDPSEDTFVMKTDLNLNPIWAKAYPLEQTSPYGFDVASDESYIIIITIHSSKFTIVKVDPSDGTVTEKRTNADLNSSIDKIYVSLSSSAVSIFFTAVNPSGFIWRSSIGSLVDFGWLNAEKTVDVLAIKAHDDKNVTWSASAGSGYTGTHIRSYFIHGEDSYDINWNKRYELDSSQTSRNLIEIYNDVAYHFLSISTGKAFLAVSLDDGSLLHQFSSNPSSWTYQKSSNILLNPPHLYIITLWDITLILTYSLTSNTFTSTLTSPSLTTLFLLSNRFHLTFPTYLQSTSILSTLFSPSSFSMNPAVLPAIVPTTRQFLPFKFDFTNGIMTTTACTVIYVRS